MENHIRIHETYTKYIVFFRGFFINCHYRYKVFFRLDDVLG
jgi:hypothetical protein